MSNPVLKAINIQLDRCPVVKAINFIKDNESTPNIKSINFQIDLVDSVNIRGPIALKSNTVFN